MADADEQPGEASQPSREEETTTESNANTPSSDKKKSIFSRFLTAFGEKAKRPLGLLADNPITLKNLILSAVTVGLEILLNKEFFNCPLKGYKQYGWVFIFAPTPIMFCANVLIIGQMWELSSRCCFDRYRRRGDVFARLIPNIFKAMVGPGVWVVATFADSDYYVCATVGPGAVKRNLTDEDEIKELEEKIDAAKSSSHMWGWFTFLILVVGCTIIIVMKNCFLKDNVLLENAYEFERREAIQALRTFQKLNRGVLKGKKPNTDTTPPGDGDESARETGNEEEEVEVFLGNHEKVKLWSSGIPERTGKREVEKMFEGWFKEDKNWSYVKAHEAFKAKYPRAASGDPGEAWRTCHNPPETQPPATPSGTGAPSPSPHGSVTIPMEPMGSPDHTDPHAHEGEALLP